jgi:hypothetical protein
MQQIFLHVIHVAAHAALMVIEKYYSLMDECIYQISIG